MECDLTIGRDGAGYVFCALIIGGLGSKKCLALHK